MSFEDYLIQKHKEQYQGQDNDVEDDFEEWMEDFGIDDWLYFGDLFGMSLAMDSLDNVEKRMKEGGVL